MSMIPKVILLYSNNDDTTKSCISSISTFLIDVFGIVDVSVQSTSVPVDRILALIQSFHNDGNCDLSNNKTGGVIFAIIESLLGGHGDDDDNIIQRQNSAVANVIERESPHPVLRLVLLSSRDKKKRNDAHDDAAETTTTTTAAAVATTSIQIAKLCGLHSSSVRASVTRYLSSARQASLISDVVMRTKTRRYLDAIEFSFDSHRQITGDGVVFDNDNKNLVSDNKGTRLPTRLRGKVRDRYDLSERRNNDNNNNNNSKNVLAIVTTDRQSGFDRMLALVPYKGAVLNLTSAYWFDVTKHIIPNHLVDVPHPNVCIVKKCKPFPIEFVVRAYMTGSTSTSIWKNYENSVRNYCGHTLPEGLFKNQKLWQTLLTPTTKEEEHDRPISSHDIVSEGWMSQEDFDTCAKAALDIFALGQRLSSERGLILVDTKYEFGTDEEGNVLLIDEVHTPDSSRYWLASSYEERISRGLEPENIDKEFLRLWFRDHCDPYKDETLPEAPRELVVELARRYVSLYEMITWKEFKFDPEGEDKIAEAILKSL